MHQITFHLDFLSPYAYLAFEKLPEALQGLSVHLHYRPVLLAGLLQHHGQRGPAEVPPKRDWTYRQVAWLGHSLGVPLDMPARHPFNPLPLLRLAVACGGDAGLPNRHVCETIFRHVWRSGADAADPQRLAALQAQLQPPVAPDSAPVKTLLRAHTEEAAAVGVFGVPSLVVDGRLFWGLDALPMLRAHLDGDAWFRSGAWEAAPDRPVGAHRR